MLLAHTHHRLTVVCLHGKYVFTVFVTETKTTVFHCFSKQVDSYLVEYGRGGCVGRVGAAGTVRVWIGDRRHRHSLRSLPFPSRAPTWDTVLGSPT